MTNMTKLRIELEFPVADLHSAESIRNIVVSIIKNMKLNEMTGSVDLLFSVDQHTSFDTLSL